MSYIEPRNYEEIIHYIQQTMRLVESGELSIADGASNVVGATLANNSVDIDTLYLSHPGLEELVELCADTETYDDAKKPLRDPSLPEYVVSIWQEVQDSFKRLKVDS